MHKNFGEWYRMVSIAPTDELLKKRWAGVERWVSEIRGNDEAILETVRIFQGLPMKTSRDAFLTAFRDHDAAFAQRNNDLEQRVLAGAALVECVRAWDSTTAEDEDALDGQRAAIIAGSAVEASSLRAKDEKLEEIVRDVVAELQRLAKEQRKRIVFEGEVAAKADAAAAALTKIPAVGNWDQFKAQFAPVLQHLVDALRASDEALSAAAHNVQRADEETNILWWLEGGSSRDLDKPWDALPNEAVPLIAGSELADLTDVALGPQDAGALLARTVSRLKGKDATLLAYVNAVPEEWLRGGRMSGAIDLTPLAFALARRAEGNAASWKESFEASTGLKASMPLAPESAARCTYIEAVLLRTLAETAD